MTNKQMQQLHTASRSREDRHKLEKRRLKAADYFDKGYTPAAVQRKLGGSLKACAGWWHTWHNGGREALQSSGTPGPSPSLNDEQKGILAAELCKGAGAHGYPNEVWTLERVSALIRARFDVSLEGSRVSEILRHDLGFSKQKPERRSRKRDEKKIAAWKRATLPALKKRDSTKEQYSGSSTRVRSRTSHR